MGNYKRIKPKKVLAFHVEVKIRKIQKGNKTRLRMCLLLWNAIQKLFSFFLWSLFYNLLFIAQNHIQNLPYNIFFTIIIFFVSCFRLLNKYLHSQSISNFILAYLPDILFPIFLQICALIVVYSNTIMRDIAKDFLE